MNEVARGATAPTETAEHDDPHASKIAPDDPRLRIERPRSRALRMKPIVGLVTLLVAGGALAVVTGLRKDDKKVRATEEPPPSARPSVPAFLEEMPDAPEPSVPMPPPELGGFRDQPPMPVQPSARWADTRAEQERARLAELDREAQTSSLFFDSGRSSPGGARAAETGAPGALPAAGGLPAMPLAPGQGGEGWDPNLQGRKNAFLDVPRSHSEYLATGLLPALSPYEVKATTVIPATLVTGINSDLPGPIIAQVREQVYDTVSGQHLLIPQGARLLASYDSMVAWGQERVLMCWNRIIFPNGNSISLECMPAADLKGQAGLTDEVDQHWDRLMAAVGLSTVLSLGAQAAAGDPTGYQPNLAQSAARNAAGQINQAGQGIVQRQLNLQPTITVRPGFGVNVIVTKDMILEPYIERSFQ